MHQSAELGKYDMIYDIYIYIDIGYMYTHIEHVSFQPTIARPSQQLLVPSSKHLSLTQGRTDLDE